MEDIKVLDEQSRHPESAPSTDPNFMEFDSGTHGEEANVTMEDLLNG